MDEWEGLTSQNRSYFSRVTRNREPSTIITPKHIINHLLTPNILISRQFTLKWLPKQIILRKPSLNLIARESIMDISLSSSSITSVTTNVFEESSLTVGINGFPDGRSRVEKVMLAVCKQRVRGKCRMSLVLGFSATGCGRPRRRRLFGLGPRRWG